MNSISTMKTKNKYQTVAKRLILSVSILLFITQVSAASKTLFDNNWRFRLGDDSLAIAPSFDDSQWRKLTLPHDWSVEGEFNKYNPAGNNGGFLPCGIGWYRKTFDVPTAVQGKQLLLYFEGVYMNASVYVNGKKAGGYPYGYSSFYVDITGYVLTGQANVVAVRVDNSQQKNSRWYSGSGIYRHVWLEERTQGGINDPWKLYLQTDTVYGISHDGTQADSAILRISYKGCPDELRIYRRVKLWSPDQPALYEVKVGELYVEHGFRTIKYSATKGFLLNDKPILINGGCLHHDNGILGAAAFDKAEWRKAELMKQAGFNAVRTSHNVPSPEFLRACDHLGLMVIDEPFDGWRDKKNEYDYHLLIDEWWQKDIDAMVLRDRNHPSIICWSNGNEVMERKKIEVVTTSRKMAERMRALDPSRPVTQALASWDKDWEIYDPLAATLDITGYNYMIHKAESDHERVPSRVMWQTESYPRQAFSNWAKVNDYPYIIGDFVWTALDYLGESSIGTWHYEGENRGEHHQGEHFPYHGAYCGDIDLTGWRKPISHYREILWSEEGLYMAVKEPQDYYGHISETHWSVWPTWESWNWARHEGKQIEVEVYSRYPKTRLYLNGELVGEKATTRDEKFKAVFPMTYRPGVLRAVGLREDGTEDISSERILRTSGKPTRLKLSPTQTTMTADGQDITWVTVEVVDNNDVLVADASNKLHFTVSGQAQLIATGNANLKDTVSYASSDREAWKGRAIVVLRSGNKPGKVVLSVSSEGLPTARQTIRIYKSTGGNKG